MSCITTDLGKSNPDEGKPFAFVRFDIAYQNDRFCKSEVFFTNPHGTPDDEVALVYKSNGSGIMMEWGAPH